MGFQLHERTPRKAQVTKKLLRVLPTLAFGYVRGNRGGRPPDLAAHSEELFLWKALRRAVTLLRQIHAHLPDFQFLVTLDPHLVLLAPHWAVARPPPDAHYPPRSTLHAPPANPPLRAEYSPASSRDGRLLPRARR